MRTILVLASSAFAATTLSAGIAAAGDRINVTAPITREHARAIRTVPTASELTVVPQPVPAAAPRARVSAATSRFELADR